MNINDLIKENKSLEIKKYNPAIKNIIYFICETNGEIIYIGSTTNLQTRLQNHATRIEFYEKPVFFFACSNSKNKCLKKERELIEKIEPKYNVQWINGEYYPSIYKNISIKKYNEIGKTIVAFLKKENISQALFAKRMEVSRQRVGQIIHNKGQRKLHPTTLKKIALAIGLSVKELSNNHRC